MVGAMRIVVLLTCFLLAGALPSLAASSPWWKSEGVALRLVTTGPADAAGTLRGALEIALEPGWKTYWRDPGDTGVPPAIDASGTKHVAAAELAFPAPVRVDEGYGSWAGYTEAVTLPVTFALDGAVKTLEAKIFLGVCREICIPVQTVLSLDPSAGAERAEDRATVQAAFAALPRTPSATFGVRKAEIDGETLRIEASLPPGSGDARLFLASAEGFTVGVPEPAGAAKGGVSFSARLIDFPKGRAAFVPPLDYTLVSGGRAVSGTLPQGAGTQ